MAKGVTSFVVETESGRVSISLRSTGHGGWVAAKLHNPHPFGMKITRAQWVPNAASAVNMILGGTED